MGLFWSKMPFEKIGLLGDLKKIPFWRKMAFLKYRLEREEIKKKKQ
jgi:hypothetical protein